MKKILLILVLLLAGLISVLSTEKKSNISTSNVVKSKQKSTLNKHVNPIQQHEITKSTGAREIKISPHFVKLILANPILMYTGGCRIIVTPNKRKLIVSVAVTDVRGNSSAEQLRRLKVCKIKAHAAIVKNKGIYVTYLNKSKDGSITKTKNGKEEGQFTETYIEITTEYSQGYLRSLPVIGQWYSEDKKLFFLAVGGFLDE